MAFHVTLLEPSTPATVGNLAKCCLAADASLHLVGPMPFKRDDARLLKAGPDNWGGLDWWLHPGWRDFRDAMTRERCLYFAVDAERETADAPFRPNSVLVLGTEAGTLPDRIKEKYPNRIFKLPMPARKRKVDLAASADLLLGIAAERLAGKAKAKASSKTDPAKPMRYGRAPRRR